MSTGTHRAVTWLEPVWQVALADFRERSRSRSFVLILLLCGGLAGLVLRGDMMLAVGGYRGAHNAAWVGAQMALVFNTMMSLFGYFLIQGGMARDARAGVAELLGSTGLGALRYVLGKWLSHVMLLLGMLLVMLAMAAVQQFFPPAGLAQEPMGSAWLAAQALLGPFLVISLPLLMLLAALCLVFESLPWLRGAMGHGLVFLTMGMLMSQAVIRSERGGLEPLGISQLVPDMRAALLTQYPQERLPGFTLGGGFTSAKLIKTPAVFHWNGMRWTAGQVLGQWLFVLPAGGLLLLATALHARYGWTTRRSPAAGAQRSGARRWRRAAPAALPGQASGNGRVEEPASAPGRGAGLHTPASRIPAPWRAWALLVRAELGLMWRQPRWWQVGALGWMVAGALLPQGRAQHDVLLASLAWMVPALAPLGCRAAMHGAGALLGSSALSGRAQALAAWTAGSLFCLIPISGGMLGAVNADQLNMACAALSACLFLPALLLALGRWSAGPHLGEAVGMLWLLLGWQGLSLLDPLSAGALVYAGLAGLGLLAAHMLPRSLLERLGA